MPSTTMRALSSLARFKDWVWKQLGRKGLVTIALAGLVASGSAVTGRMRDPCLDAKPVISGASVPRDQQGMVRLQFAGDVPTATSVIADWNANCPAGLAPASRNLRWDYLFIVIYVAGIGLLTLITMAAMRTALLRLLGMAVTVLTLFAGLLDVLENLSLSHMLGGPFGDIWPILARVFASVKLALLAIAIAYVTLGWVYLLFRWLRGDQQVYRAAAADQAKGPTSVPQRGSELPGHDGPSAPLEAVLAAELKHLEYHRPAKQLAGSSPILKGRTLVGLSLSGGGIRSATTNLGVLQALADLKILPFVDYLCTVSGGGYIGSCLSALLSLNSSATADLQTPPVALPPQAPTPAPRDPHLFGPREMPAFSTSWSTFPFRDDFVGAAARTANALIGHLRTHGNFLIARRGLIKRDTMRAIGNILTGIVYNVSGFVVILLTATALYLWIAISLVPGLEESLGPVQQGSAQTATLTGAPGPIVGDSTVKRRQSVSCAPPAQCAVETTITLNSPTLVSWVGLNLKRVAAPVDTLIRGEGDRANGIRVVLIGAAVTGALLPMLAGLLISVATWLFDSTKLPPPPPGEGYEETFDKALLWLMVLVSGLWIVSSIAVFYHWVPSGGLARLVVLWIPAAVLLSARVITIAIAAVVPQFKLWKRRFRSLWGGYQAIAIYGLWGSAAVLLLAPMIFAFAGNRASAGVGAIASLGAARLFTPVRSTGGERRLRIPKGLQHFLLGVAVVLVIVLGMIAIGAILVTVPATASNLFVTTGIGLSILIGLGLIVDHNKMSPHYFYRDRLAETYLLSELPDTERRLKTFQNAMEMPLHRLHGSYSDPLNTTARNSAPYHLISAAINLAGSRDLTRKDRKSGYWLFSKLYCGSTHTGFRPTEVYRGGETKLARAMAISGAAASSAIGFGTFFAQSFATVLFNVRLGSWLENPAFRRSRNRSEGGIFWPWYLGREVAMNTSENTRLVNLSDGGHTGDNVGIYPLLQRRCKVIIACDAEQDGALTFSSFTEALRHAYIDLGISVDIDLSLIRPDAQTGRSRSHCAVGRIRYPDRRDQASYLVYLKNSLTGDEPEPVLNYKISSPDFPHETTADQFFDDAQFESYRALGVHITKSTFASWSSSVAFLTTQAIHDPLG